MFMITEKGQLSQARRNWTSRFRGLKIDSDNRRKYGVNAPQYAELLWVGTKDVECGLKKWTSKQSAQVVDDWPVDLDRPLQEWKAIGCCLQHWQAQASWEETGLVDQMMSWIREKGKVDRLSSHEEVLQRYQQLDHLYETVVAERRLRTRKELVAGNFREEGGILVHLGPDGRPYFGGKGNHRLAIAIAAGLEYFPAQLGVVHVSALNSLSRYRNGPVLPSIPIDGK